MFFFFSSRRRHTICGRDWSSDVCSSDLTDDRYDALFLTNYAQINLVNQIGSLGGVGESRLSSQQVYSMRVWLNPDKMTKLGITATDVSNAVQAQNRQNPAGAIGQSPSPSGTDFQYAVSGPGRLI